MGMGEVIIIPVFLDHRMGDPNANAKHPVNSYFLKKKLFK